MRRKSAVKGCPWFETWLSLGVIQNDQVSSSHPGVPIEPGHPVPTDRRGEGHGKGHVAWRLPAGAEMA
jgi:hypothetical protein